MSRTVSLRHPAALPRLIGPPIVIAALCLAGCGTRLAGASAGASASVSDGAAPCAASALRIRLDTSAAGVAAGTSLVPLDFTNTTSASCALAGYPTVSFAASQAGGQVGEPGAADRTAAPERLLLAPGESAHVWLRLASAENFPATQCGPVTVAGFRVWLPGWAAGSFVACSALICAKVIHGSQILTIEPFSPGLARRGTA